MNAIEADNAARRTKIRALARFRLAENHGSYNLLVRLLRADGKWDVDQLISDALTEELLMMMGLS